MNRRSYKISFCIVCMNRLHHLKKTLVQNIIDNESYNNLEFVVLNYNSQDGMDEWMRKEMQTYISSGKVAYYLTTEPSVFSHSHSKNIAFKLAKGEIVCSINADHFTGKNFAQYVNDCFQENDKITLTTVDYFKVTKGYYPAKDVYGKVCVRKNDFLEVAGFDEMMNGYGFEDWDFVNRLELAGRERKFITNPSFLKFISHDNTERYSLANPNLYGIYLNFIDPSTTDVIILYNNKQYEQGTVVDNSSLGSENYKYAYLPRNYKFANSLREDGWISGTVETDINDENIIMFPRNNNIQVPMQFLEDKNRLLNKNNGAVYYKINHPETIDEIMDFNYVYPNRMRMEKNLSQKIIKTNTITFGQAYVLNNFKPTPIFI